MVIISQLHSAKNSLLVLISTMLFASCTADSSDDPQQVTSAATRSSVEANKVIKMSRQEQVLFARQDLASRLSIGIDEVSLSGAAPVLWRSNALGCPKSGMEYPLMLVKGVLIMLRVEHTPYRYHSIPTGEPFYCPDDQAEAPYTNSSDI